jgi:hypothetical protein
MRQKFRESNLFNFQYHNLKGIFDYQKQAQKVEKFQHKQAQQGQPKEFFMKTRTFSSII